MRQINQVAPYVIVALGTVIAFVIAYTLWDGTVAEVRKKWRQYQTWANNHLRALYSPIRARDFALRQVGAAAIGLLSGGVLMSSWTYGAILAIFFSYLPVFWLERERTNRKKALDAQLDATLQSMANTILVTQNLEDAFATIAQHFDPPMSQEADVLVKQVRLGTPMDEALRDLAVRCQSRNIDAVVTALTVGRQTGGELPKVLETIAEVLRETMRVEGVMESKTSEGKAQVVVMGMLPILFGGALQVIDPEWMRPVFNDPIGWAVLAFACLLEVVGLLMVRKLTAIDV